MSPPRATPARTACCTMKAFIEGNVPGAAMSKAATCSHNTPGTHGTLQYVPRASVEEWWHSLTLPANSVARRVCRPLTTGKTISKQR